MAGINSYINYDTPADCDYKSFVGDQHVLRAISRV